MRCYDFPFRTHTLGMLTSNNHTCEMNELPFLFWISIQIISYQCLRSSIDIFTVSKKLMKNYFIIDMDCDTSKRQGNRLPINLSQFVLLRQTIKRTCRIREQKHSTAIAIFNVHTIFIERPTTTLCDDDDV